MGKVIYCDHNATTAPDRRVVEKMAETATVWYGNASSPHRLGQAARGYLEESRATVAGFLGARPNEIVFTGSGTEADNLAILGTAFRNADKGRHLVTTAIEHHAVLSCAEFLEAQGWEVTLLPVDRYGMVDLGQFGEALRKDTVLASVMMINNEVGTIQPIKELAGIARERGVLFHTDAVQAVGKMPVDVHDLGVDLLAFSAHKFYGPKGVGGLYVKTGTPIGAYIHGGGQEGTLRSGTENVPAIVGMAEAMRILGENPDANNDALSIANEFEKRLFATVPDIALNGHPEQRIKTTANISFAGVNGEALVIALDLSGICVSSGSACSTGAMESSHVLRAMGLDHGAAESSIRFSFGRLNDHDDIDVLVKTISREVERLRGMSPLYQAGNAPASIINE